MGRLALNGAFWRSLARWGANGPDWFVRFAPPVVACAIFMGATEQRQAIVRNLRRVRGARGGIRDRWDAARTFVNYASCLTEVLGSSSREDAPPSVTVYEAAVLSDALADGKGVIFATAHTAGWEISGPCLARERHLEVMIVERAESDAMARTIQDDARRGHGVRIVHVGDDPFSALPLLHHLRRGGAVALQIDRVVSGAKAREVVLFGRPGKVPEGPLRLAMLSGAPIVPVFSFRQGPRRYGAVLSRPIRLQRTADQAEVDAAAQALADRLAAFVRYRPTQWFHFREQ